MGDDGKRIARVSISGTFVNSPPVVGDGNTVNVYAPPPPKEPRHNNLPPRNHDFVGREDELQRIHDLLSQGTAVALMVAGILSVGFMGFAGLGG